jgi:hypothetical protein
LEALQSTGREIDNAYVDYLETKYNTNLPELRLTCNVFRATYGMWEVTRTIRDEANWESQEDHLARWLDEIMDAGRKLSRLEAKATHSTSYTALDSIKASSQIKSSFGAEQFEGNGVYVGLMGSYRGWSDQYIEFVIKVKDILPIIVNFNDPKMMGNVLCDFLDVDNYQGGSIAIPKGNIQWLHQGNDLYELTVLQKKLFEERVGSVIQLDHKGSEVTWIIDTEEPPIVYAMLARALRIPQVISEYEIPFIKSEDEIRQEVNKPLLSMTQTRLRGIRHKDLIGELD